jgi:hypothetical protein
MRQFQEIRGGRREARHIHPYPDNGHLNRSLLKIKQGIPIMQIPKSGRISGRF